MADRNPSVVSATKAKSTSDLNSSGKIVMHDGREVDPSDHLPMDTWAPEPEPKKPTNPAHNAQAMTSSGRRQLKIAGRPNVSPHTFSSGNEPPTAAASTLAMGRNKLQKKANRASAMPVMMPHSGSSPLAPIHNTHHQDNFTPPPMRSLPRANTFDFPNENHMPMYGSSPGGGARGPGASSAPPIPAKVPLSSSYGAGGNADGMMMSGALVPARGSMGGGSGGGGWNDDGQLSLAEEMSRIDIGTGRSRRHHRY